MSAKENLKKYFKETLEQWNSKRNPYVWRLGLSLSFYTDAMRLLEAAIAEEGGVEFLYERDFAPIALIILGEWYKRDYTGNNSDNPEWVKDTEWKSVWDACGKKNWKRWVYKFEDTGNISWQYSAYVLGGLACRYLNQMSADTDLLKKLCMLYHGQIHESEIRLDGNAKALSMSIEKEHSIYKFIKKLTDARSELSDTYKNDNQEQVRNLRMIIQDANKEVTKNKLRSEWLYTTSVYESDKLLRSLKISFATENVDGEKRLFLSRERAKEWGINLSSTLEDIDVMLSFYLKEQLVDKPRLVMTFQPSGSLNAGFNLVSLNPWKVISDLPEDFDSWRLSAVTNDGQNVSVGPLVPVADWTQVYQTANHGSIWSSKWKKMSSAVIFNDKCRITDPQGHPIIGKKLLVDFTPANNVNWANIPAMVKLEYPSKNGKLKEEILTSPLTDCRLRVTNLFTDLIDYLPEGQINVKILNNPTGEVVEEQMQLAFGLDHIQVEWLEDGKHPRSEKAASIIAKQNGKICEIGDLKKGVVILTAFAEGMRASAKVWYIPTEGKKVPGERDLNNKIVKWYSSSKGTYPAQTADSLEDSQSTIEIEDTDIWGNTAVINVFQPLEVTEIWLRDKRVCQPSSREITYISMLRLPNIIIRKFDNTGFHQWDGIDLMNKRRDLVKSDSGFKESEIPDIFIINFKKVEEKDIPTKNSVRIGNYLFEKDDPDRLRAPEYWKEEVDVADDLFGDAQVIETIQPEIALEAAIEHNLYSFFFTELSGEAQRIPEWMDTVRKLRGEDFLRKHREAVIRILWENNLTTKDLNFEI